ncbi:MAG: class I SAM-dependent methyltransferase [Deltaproteobacteria bacterium]|nr:class I SAM-dependent methyltransferase [Deltaproteobacteria bacterium]MBW2382441.1 class I SAM-dependent methyltransferase [Deltaproteobacteria bacterium]MBW2697552.1 class I SAM-dependent methyltransferase [Deltaproteobacteria bacterium]
MAVIEASPPRCLICRSDESRRRYAITRFDVVECRACGQIYLHPLPDPGEIRVLFESLYSTGDGSLPELRDYYQFCYTDSPDNPLTQRYEVWLDKIESVRKPGRVLDIGCGTGLFLSVARRRGWEPYGIDESVEATDYARGHFGLDPWVGDFESFAGTGEQFDLVTGWDVIEHSRDPVSLLHAARQCLVGDGILSLSTPNQRSILDLVAGAMYRTSGGRLTAPLEKFYIEQHFLYFTPSSLGEVLSLAGLEITQMDLELTDLRRLTLPPLVRAGLHTMFLAARVLGRQNRLFIIARARA